MTTTIKTNKPHPLSYRPDAPLGGWTVAQLHATTREDRAWYAAHPLVMVANPPEREWSRATGKYARDRAEWPDGADTVWPKVQSQLDIFNIILPVWAEPSDPGSVDAVTVTVGPAMCARCDSILTDIPVEGVCRPCLSLAWADAQAVADSPRTHEVAA